ncbi:FAD/NAD(P)-binding oxidoreductase [Pseudonocardia nematodicida]|uniref:FAD/NAD(P)-binding oxidoreductase n=1 Tax=Pseudonocardia nematodicida TaxID=1206997 RepID=A0ABV1K5K6_9PSEU
MRRAGRRGRIAVLGASAAGLAAAETLRTQGFDDELVIVGAEPHLPYKRPPLSKQVLDGRWAADRAFLRTAAEIEELDASWSLGVRAVGLDPAARRVTLSDRSVVEYDGLVIATGVSPRRLAHGHDLAGVQVLRTLEDAQAVGRELVAGRRLVIVGAGFLGCEVAAVARRSDVHVTLVDPLPAPMIRQLGSDIARHVAALHTSHGTEVRTGVGVRALTGVDGRVTTVELTDGSVLAADAVLVAIGSTPNVGWLAGSGLSLTDGVDCDARCRAGTDIVAAGDVASWEHPGFGRRMRVEHQTNALEQGAAAARSLLGTEAEDFAPVPFFWSDQYDVKLQVYGAPHESATKRIVRGDPAEGRFAATYQHDGRLVAVLTWNMPREALGLREQLVAEMEGRGAAAR